MYKVEYKDRTYMVSWDESIKSTTIVIEGRDMGSYLEDETVVCELEGMVLLDPRDMIKRLPTLITFW